MRKTVHEAFDAADGGPAGLFQQNASWDGVRGRRRHHVAMALSTAILTVALTVTRAVALTVSRAVPPTVTLVPRWRSTTS